VLVLASRRNELSLSAATDGPELAWRSKAGSVSLFGRISWFPDFLISFSVFHSDAFEVGCLALSVRR